jgi:hypothetical protein
MVWKGVNFMLMGVVRLVSSRLSLAVVLLVATALRAQHVDVDFGGPVFSYDEPLDTELVMDSPPANLQTAALSWCESLRKHLTVEASQCMQAVVVQTLVALQTQRTPSIDDDDQHDGQDGNGTCSSNDASCSSDPRAVVFNCMLPVAFDDGSMNVMAFLDFFEGEEPAAAAERMRRDFNSQYEDEPVGAEQLGALTSEVAAAAKLCPPTARACNFTGASALRSLHCYRGRRSRLLQQGYWEQLGAEFNLSITGRVPSSPPVRLSPERMKRVRAELDHKGYTRVPAAELNSATGSPAAARIKALAGMMEKLHRLRLPPSCIIFYDEAFQVFHPSMDAFVGELLGGAVEPQDIGGSLYAVTQHALATRESDLYTSSAGHAPHRDGAGPQSGLAGGNIQAWVPFTDHDPYRGQSALHMLPKHLDTMIDLPGSPSPISVLRNPSSASPTDALYNRRISFDMQSMRAVPAYAGDLILWEGRVLHWSSSADQGTEGGDHLQSRLASAFWAKGAQKHNDCKALRHFPALPWNARLALVCGQLWLHIRHYPAFYDFIGTHFRLCPKRDEKGLWDPRANPQMKAEHALRKAWVSGGGK